MGGREGDEVEAHLVEAEEDLELGLQATAFDVRDALQKCEALGLIAQAPSGSWLAKAPCEALDMLADAKK